MRCNPDDRVAIPLSFEQVTPSFWLKKHHFVDKTSRLHNFDGLMLGLPKPVSTATLAGWKIRKGGWLMTSHWMRNEPDVRALPVAVSVIDRIIVGDSLPAVHMKRLIAAVAVSDAPVLVQGQTGTGKELVAEALHKASGRIGQLIAVNCAAIPAELLESELFGHEKGSFTGADRQRIGQIELAQGGTLFLDEIGDMPPALQAKLLRVLETKRVKRVGSGDEFAVDFRLVTATHRDLEAQVRCGAFRADLFYRINVFPVCVPDLSERASDIPLLLARMINDHLVQSPAADAPHFDASALRSLAMHDWPGNIRELRNILMRAFVIFPGRMVNARQVRENLLNLCLPDPHNSDGTKGAAASPQAQGLPDPSCYGDLLANRADLDMRCYLRDIEVALIESALGQRNGCVTQAADVLHLRRTTLIEKMKKFGILRSIEG